MLTSDDIATVRFAIRRRLEQETGVEIIQILAEPDDGHVRIGVHLWLGKLLQLKSVFHLPDPFEHSHLVNQIDEIAEGCKGARRDFFKRGMVAPQGVHGRQLKGTGLRDHWRQYGLRVS